MDDCITWECPITFALYVICLKYKCWITYVDNQIVFSSVTTSY